MFYSKSTNGFYDAAIHGERTLSIIDSSWQRPSIDLTLAPGESISADLDGEWRIFENNTDKPLLVRGVPDMSVEAPSIEVDNPETKIPADAVEISIDEHAALIDGQSKGMRIIANEDGFPVLADHEPLTEAELIAAKKAEILREIGTLENQQARPVREIMAAMAAGKSAPQLAVARLAEIDASIAALRALLP